MVKDGDRIIIDAQSRSIQWEVDEAEQKARLKAWKATGAKPLREKRGVLYRYARDVAVSILTLFQSRRTLLINLTYSLQVKAPIRIEDWSSWLVPNKMYHANKYVFPERPKKNT